LSHLPKPSRGGHSPLHEVTYVWGGCCNSMAKHVLYMGSDFIQDIAVLSGFMIF